MQGEKGKYQNANIVLHVRGIGRNTQTEDKDPKKVWKRKRGKKSKLNSWSSPGNKSVGRDAIFLPPIESCRIVSQNTDVSIVLGKTKPPHCRFDFAIDALMNVIERHKEERELNRERFHNDIIRGQQKPINENLRYTKLKQAAWKGTRKQYYSGNTHTKKNLRFPAISPVLVTDHLTFCQSINAMKSQYNRDARKTSTCFLRYVIYSYTF